jgi:hypothetical protein
VSFLNYSILYEFIFSFTAFPYLIKKSSGFSLFVLIIYLEIGLICGLKVKPSYSCLSYSDFAL